MAKAIRDAVPKPAPIRDGEFLQEISAIIDLAVKQGRFDLQTGNLLYRHAAGLVALRRAVRRELRNAGQIVV